jgi:hypothetical protein
MAGAEELCIASRPRVASPCATSMGDGCRRKTEEPRPRRPSQLTADASTGRDGSAASITITTSAAAVQVPSAVRVLSAAHPAPTSSTNATTSAVANAQIVKPASARRGHEKPSERRGRSSTPCGRAQGPRRITIGPRPVPTNIVAPSGEKASARGRAPFQAGRARQIDRSGRLAPARPRPGLGTPCAHDRLATA